jgi:oligopeptidase A
MSHIPNRNIREKVYRASHTRASEFTENDGGSDKNNVAYIYDMLGLKKDRGRMLGFNSTAEMSIATKMASSVESVIDFLKMILEKALPAALREFEEITLFARSNGGDKYSEENLEGLMPWDISFWSQRLKESTFNLKEEELRSFLPFPSVLDGMFGLVERIFNIKVKKADGEVDVGDKDVSFFNVFDKDSQKHIGRFYLDLYSRPAEKRGGAWMNVCIGKSEAVDRDIPVAYLNCNGSPPIGDTPSLMTFHEVKTLFHEFGHGLQHMLTTATVGDVAGLHGIARDAREISSQFMENWCYNKNTLRGLTDQPLPESIRMGVKLIELKTYGAGMMICRQILLSLLDMELYHDFDPEFAKNGGPTVFDVHRSKAKQCTPYTTLIENDRFLCTFHHIFGGAYSAGYYSYMWAEVMAADAFGAFEEVGLNNAEKVKEVGLKFRDTILSLGGGIDPMLVFKEFRGREPSPDALLRQYGLV